MVWGGERRDELGEKRWCCLVVIVGGTKIFGRSDLKIKRKTSLFKK